MTNYKNSKGSFLFVPLPEDATNAGWMFGCFTVDMPNGKGGIMHKWITDVDDYQQTMKKSQCLEFLFTTNTATNEDAAKVVEYENNVTRGYKEYGSNGRLFSSPLESLSSLLHSLNIEGCVAVLKIN